MPTSIVSYDRFAVDLPLMFDYTANLLYPDLHPFGGISSLREFYEQFYDRTFTDEQLENMLKGLNPDGTIMVDRNLEWEEISTEHIVNDEWIDFRKSAYSYFEERIIYWQ